jgi:hypothetical protein
MTTDPIAVAVAPVAVSPTLPPPTAAPPTAAAPTSPPPPPAASPDARRIAVAILEVLAGIRSITDAAVALGVAPARYYVLEARAVAGLIAACEPRAPGPLAGGGLAGEVDRLRAERDRLRDEAARYQALARIAQSAFAPLGGLGASAAVPPPAGTTVRQQRAARAAAHAASPPAPAGAKPRRKRVPTVRALRLAQQVGQLPHRAALPASPPMAMPVLQQPQDRAP